jgi:hypothetical protein
MIISFNTAQVLRYWALAYGEGDARKTGEV